MNTDDILCEARGPGGLTCTKPYGHKPEKEHAFSAEIPGDLGQIIEGIMRATEEARVRYVKARRRENIMFFIWLGMAALYVVLIMTKVSS